MAEDAGQSNHTKSVNEASKLQTTVNFKPDSTATAPNGSIERSVRSFHLHQLTPGKKFTSSLGPRIKTLREFEAALSLFEV